MDRKGRWKKGEGRKEEEITKILWDVIAITPLRKSRLCSKSHTVS